MEQIGDISVALLLSRVLAVNFPILQQRKKKVFLGRVKQSEVIPVSLVYSCIWIELDTLNTRKKHVPKFVKF